LVSLANPKAGCSLGAAEGKAVLLGTAARVFDWLRMTARRLGLDVLRVTMRRLFGRVPGILSKFDDCDSTLGLFDGTWSAFSGRGRLANTPV
jgi:hypothetical protein